MFSNARIVGSGNTPLSLAIHMVLSVRSVMVLIKSNTKSNTIERWYSVTRLILKLTLLGLKLRKKNHILIWLSVSTIKVNTMQTVIIALSRDIDSIESGI